MLLYKALAFLLTHRSLPPSALRESICRPSIQSNPKERTMTMPYTCFIHNHKKYAKLVELLDYCGSLKKTSANTKKLLEAIETGATKEHYIELDISPSVFVDNVCYFISSDEDLSNVVGATQRVLDHSFCRLGRCSACSNSHCNEYFFRVRKLNCCFELRSKPPMPLSKFAREIKQTIDQIKEENDAFRDIAEAKQLKRDFPDINDGLHRNGTY